MQDAGAHVRELAQLAVSDRADALGIAHDARISHQEAGDIGPVFIHVRMQAFGEDAAGNIASAPGHDADLAVRRAAVKARDDKGLVVARQPLQALFAEIKVKASVITETDDIFGIDERIAQVFRHQPCGQVFTAADELIEGDGGLHLIPDGIQLPLDRAAQPQLIADLDITFPDHLEYRGAVDVIFHMRMAQIKQIGHFVVGLGRAPDRADDDETRGRIAFYDMLDFAELCGICHRRSAEFGDLDHARPRLRKPDEECVGILLQRQTVLLMHLYRIHVPELTDLAVRAQHIIAGKQGGVKGLFAHLRHFERFAARDGDQIADDGIAGRQAAGALAVKISAHRSYHRRAWSD